MRKKTSRTYISAYNQLLKECDTIYHNAAARASISDCAFWILYTLQETEHTYTQSEICGSTLLPKQMVNSALKKLEKDDYLTLGCGKGKTGKSIHLTAKGKDFVEKYILPVMEAEERACALFPNDEKEMFLSLFRLLVDRLKVEISQAQAGGIRYDKG